MKLALLAILALASTGCCGVFRDPPTVMYRDGWGGTAVVIPSACNPVPYGAAMPQQPVPGTTGPAEWPAELESGWYLGHDNQWRSQRWVRLGTQRPNNAPTYVAVYP